MARFLSGARMVRLARSAQANTGTIAEGLGFAIDAIHVTEALQQAGGIQRGLLAAGFVVNQQQAQGTGP